MSFAGNDILIDSLLKGGYTPLGHIPIKTLAGYYQELYVKEIKPNVWDYALSRVKAYPVGVFSNENNHNWGTNER